MKHLVKGFNFEVTTGIYIERLKVLVKKTTILGNWKFFYCIEVKIQKQGACFVRASFRIFCGVKYEIWRHLTLGSCCDPSQY